MYTHSSTAHPRLSPSTPVDPSTPVCLSSVAPVTRLPLSLPPPPSPPVTPPTLLFTTHSLPPTLTILHHLNHLNHLFTLHHHLLHSPTPPRLPPHPYTPTDKDLYRSSGMRHKHKVHLISTLYFRRVTFSSRSMARYIHPYTHTPIHHPHPYTTHYTPLPIHSYCVHPKSLTNSLPTKHHPTHTLPLPQSLLPQHRNSTPTLKVLFHSGQQHRYPSTLTLTLTLTSLPHLPCPAPNPPKIPTRRRRSHQPPPPPMSLFLLQLNYLPPTGWRRTMTWDVQMHIYPLCLHQPPSSPFLSSPPPPIPRYVRFCHHHRCRVV